VVDFYALPSPGSRRGGLDYSPELLFASMTFFPVSASSSPAGYTEFSNGALVSWTARGGEATSFCEGES